MNVNVHETKKWKRLKILGGKECGIILFSFFFFFENYRWLWNEKQVAKPRKGYKNIVTKRAKNTDVIAPIQSDYI